ncbi:transcriptional activator hap2 [Cryptococcus deuterogattii R265]|nr:transcriptional activator hap2 [Cryptococcus deuterogattii R265]
MAASLPIFHLLPDHHSSYPPSPTFSDPAFSAQYDSSFPANIDLSKSNHHPLNSYSFPTPSGTSAPPQYASRHIPSYPNLVPPNFSRGSYSAVQGGQDPTAFLDLDLSQPGPSTYHRQQPQTQTQSQPQHQSTAHHYRQPDHDYVHSDAEDDESLVQVKEETQDEQQEGDAQGVDDMDSEEPLYVNAKQYHRILKRRMARARLEELNRLVRSRKPYLHESRHRHACSRPRGKGGRFLTAEEIETLKRQEAEKESKGEEAAQVSA